jgi:hypothetical protein
MSAAFEAVTSALRTSSTTITISVPTHSDGDLLLMFLVGKAVGGAPTLLAGWTSLTSEDSGPLTGAKVYVWSRIASSEPASYTVTFGTSEIAPAYCFSYSGADVPTVFSSAYQTGIGPMSVPPITPDVDDSLLIINVFGNHPLDTPTVLLPSLSWNLDVPTEGGTDPYLTSYSVLEPTATPTGTIAISYTDDEPQYMTSFIFSAPPGSTPPVTDSGPVINFIEVGETYGRALVTAASGIVSDDPYLAGWRYDSTNAIYFTETPGTEYFLQGLARGADGAMLVTIDDAPAAPDRQYINGLLADANGVLSCTTTNDVVGWVHGWPVDSIGSLCILLGSPPPSVTDRITSDGSIRITSTGATRIVAS